MTKSIYEHLVPFKQPDDPEEPDTKEYYYRYEGKSQANGGIDMLGEWQFSGSYTYRLDLYKFEILSHTPKGVWIRNWFGKRQFVNNSWNKRFACPTKEEALASLIARKQRLIRIAKARINEAEHYIEIAERHLDKLPQPKET